MTKIMPKEQTPITAEEFYYKWQTQDFEHKRIEMPNFTEEELINFGKQYAQAKVLEALEREFNHKDCININKTFFNSDGELDILSASEYYETEVKPKYDNTN